MRTLIWAAVCSVGMAASLAITAPAAGTQAPVASVDSTSSDSIPRWRSEQEWVVADISAAITNMATDPGASLPIDAVRVKTLDPSGDALASFEVTTDAGAPIRIAITDHIWAPAAYVRLAGALLPKRPDSPCADIQSPLVEHLLTPTSEVLQEQNARVSARLATDMRCAGAHEEAALLLGVLALREAAGPFTDNRKLISRMTAHLAIADLESARQPPPVRRLATALLLTLVGRQESALTVVAELERPDDGPDLRAWSRVIRTRNTLDWRHVPNVEQATLAEQLALVRALDSRIGADRSLELVDSLTNRRPGPDWARLLLEAFPLVETGNRFAEQAIEDELEDAARVRQMFDRTAQGESPEQTVAGLRVEPWPGPRTRDAVWVIDPGLWAAAAERHLMMTLLAYETHLLTRLGLPEDSAEFSERAHARFSSLTLFPLAAVILANDAAPRLRALQSAAPLVRSRPELVTDWLWKCLLQKQQGAGLREPIMASTSWFDPYFLAGTLYDLAHRPYAAGSLPRFTLPQMERLQKLAPYSREIVYELLRPLGSGASAAARSKVISPMDEYDYHLARDLAQASRADVAAYRTRMERVAALDHRGWRELATYLADRGLEDEARDAYEKWLSKNTNMVLFSNSVYWLVRYFHEHGLHERAEALANTAADAYSYGGLLTRADLHEWNGELEEAEHVLRQAADRYDTSRDLLAFLIRHDRRDAEVAALRRKIFPDGMTVVKASELKGPPREGMLLTQAGVTGERNGLRTGDVIVAVDGIRARNLEQYRVARGSSSDPVMRFTVWRAGRYAEVPAKLRYTWVVNGLDQYTPPAQRR